MHEVYGLLLAAGILAVAFALIRGFSAPAPGGDIERMIAAYEKRVAAVPSSEAAPTMGHAYRDPATPNPPCGGGGQDGARVG